MSARKMASDFIAENLFAMKSYRRKIWRLAVASSISLFLIIICNRNDSITIPMQVGRTVASTYSNIHHSKQADQKTHTLPTERLDLDEATCRTTYPLLFSDIDLFVARGPFTLYPSNSDYKGLVQARILNNKLTILSTAPDTLPTILHQRTAILSQIHRALLTSPSLLPNTTIPFVINDVPKNNSWAFSRPNKPANAADSYNTWLMPPFSAWSWPATDLGTMDEILRRISAVETTFPSWDSKIDKVIWRGTPWFNPLGHPTLRADLLKATKEKEWADVKALQGGDERMRIEEFCRYRYVVYTEGVTYSGRLPYHQACGSVLIMPPVTWVSASALLVRPIRVEDVQRAGNDDGAGVECEGDERRDGVLGVTRDWRCANAIYVKHDFSDLEEVVTALRKRPDLARRIARNQRDLVEERGYLGSAAEMCFWRELIRGWASAARVEDSEWNWGEGERYETWLLQEVGRKHGGTRGKSINTERK